jgi:hypothetical protein
MQTESATEPVSTRHTIDWRITVAIAFVAVRAILYLLESGRH